MSSLMFSTNSKLHVLFNFRISILLLLFYCNIS